MPVVSVVVLVVAEVKTMREEARSCLAPWSLVAETSMPLGEV